MRKLFVFNLTLAVLFCSVTAASARPNPKVVRLGQQVKVLEHRLQNMTIARNALKASLNQADTQNAALQSQVGGLQAALQQRTSERDAAVAQASSLQGQVSSLQAQLAAIPTPTALALQQVQREVYWAQAVTDPHSAGALTSLSAMNYVDGHVSTGAYGYLELKGLPLPTSDPDVILGTQAGICGHAVIAFATIMEDLGYSVRSVQFYWTLPDGKPDTHVSVEVYYDGGWHYFDPTFGLYWTDSTGSILSITDVRTSGGIEHKDDVAFTNLIEDPWFAGDDTAFQTDPATTVKVGTDPLATGVNVGGAPLPLWELGRR